MLCQHENRRTALRMIAFQAIVLPAMLAPCVSALCAAEPGKPSRTAMLVLQMRALGAKLPDPDLRNPDTLAGRFFGTRERRVLAEVNDPIFADLNFDEAWAKMGHSRRTFLHVLARTRAIDDTVRESLRGGATQVVILGAGYDSRAYLALRGGELGPGQHDRVRLHVRTSRAGRSRRRAAETEAGAVCAVG